MPDAHEQPLWVQPATVLASLIDEGQVSSVEVVDAHLDRISQVNPHLNAITVEMADQARASALEADRAPRTGRGPLHGVPFTIKENIDQAGFATTNGVAALIDAIPPQDAVTVQRMKAAGAVPIGRTNLPEFGLRVATENALRGRTLNPWSDAHIAGGSSGGEGSAIASGMSPIGLGNDIGGSIRNPALCCGAAGLKATSGRVPRVSGNPPHDPGISGQLMSVEGPLARTVNDLRVALGVLAGRSARDPKSVDAPLTGPPLPRRAGVVRTVPGVTLDAGVATAVESAAEELIASGWEVEEVEVPELELVKQVWAHLLAFEFRNTIPTLEPVMGEAEIAVLRALVASCTFEAPTEMTLFSERARLQRAWSEMFADYPVVVGPGWTKPAFEHGGDIVEGQQITILDDHLGFIVPANALGLPAVALATELSGGLPVGVQVYADHWREDIALDAAEIIEGAASIPMPHR